MDKQKGTFQSIGKQKAIKYARSKKWKKLSNEEKVKIQLYTKELCMPFDIFHEAMEKVLDRPVFTHEFAFTGNLQAEFEKRKDRPAFEEIVALLDSKVIVVVI